MNAPDIIAWSPSSNGLRLGLTRTGDGLRVLLENTGQASLSVLSHVVAGGAPHLDWFEVFVEEPGGRSRRLRFFADRDESASVTATLAPGARLSHDMALAYWAAQPVNGAEPLPPGVLPAHAEYRVDANEAGPSWHGSLVTPVLA
jgi:hypothetical protein